VGQITSLFVHKIVRQVDDSIDKRALLESVGVDPDAALDPKMMVSDADYYQFFERAARADPNGIELPLRVGASMRTDDYGAFGLAWKSALSLRDSCERAARYARVLTSVSTYELRDAAEGAYMLLHREGERRLGLRLSNEATIASIAAISQEVSTPNFRPLAVFFKHAAPGSAEVHERHFGCPVNFAADDDGLLMSPDALRAPNRLGDRGILSFFDRHLDQELSQFADDASLERRVRNQVAQRLSQGIPTVSEISAHLGMSARTLQRRLSSRGCTFQALVDESRRELADHLLRETEYPLAEVAFLAGFSEQSAFNRAFKRWAGQTPRSYRIEANPPT
jgi:AraC-like DNA-binding protein